jgi:hypothetical protein
MILLRLWDGDPIKVVKPTLFWSVDTMGVERFWYGLIFGIFEGFVL